MPRSKTTRTLTTESDWLILRDKNAATDAIIDFRDFKLVDLQISLTVKFPKHFQALSSTPS